MADEIEVVDTPPASALGGALLVDAEPDTGAVVDENAAPPAEVDDTDKPEAKVDSTDESETEGEESGADEDVVPETYEPFTAPEGVELDEEALIEFQGVAKELGLSQTKAQRLVDIAVKMQSSWLEKFAEAQRTAVEGWRESLKTNERIGGDKLAANLATANKAFQLVQDVPGFKELTEESGLGNHPALVEAFVRFGKLVSEDSFVDGNSKGPGGRKTLPELLYPTMSNVKG